ncbi:MAG: 3-beta hydroxysteroid dehydrogenase [Tistrella sp.]|nr:NAD-dependent epimerase/dehydratase family protein [Tistrella sp.]MAD36559.1 3-beta hydroxysteroid dehydrogenase [Tistrella sp.]MBA75665.1 3-beta hydroxysteroid dehydrogenase [Tistrella sp.]
MKIFVTGGSGFLGARLIPRLMAEGHEVLAMARSPSADGKLRALGAVPVRGDMNNPGDMAMPPVDAVIHLAAHFRFAGPRAPYFRVNVDGTKALLKAARAAGASSFIYLTAAAVIMDDHGSPIRNADERAPTFPKSFSPYIASKATSEAGVLAASGSGLRTIAIRPPGIWGPGDAFSRNIPHAIRSGRFAFIARGDYPYSTCHVDNVVEALICALDRGEGGRAYFIRDPENTTFRAFIDGLAKLQGLSIDTLRSVPYGAAFFMGRMMELGARVRRSDQDPPLSRTMVRLIGSPFTIDDSAARRDLGYVGRVSRLEGLASYGVGQPPGGGASDGCLTDAR